MNSPKRIEPLPTSGRSVPFGTAQLSEPSIGVDLATAGYTEEEYLVTGNASVWTYDESLAPARAVLDAPFVTRILVRRPLDPAIASGVVQLEPLHPDLDSAFIWSAIHPWILREGHTWVGATVYSSTAEQLRDVIDPGRYAALSIPLAGQEFDILSSVAQALRADLVPNVEVKQLVLSGWSATGSFCRVFLQDGFHERCTKPDGSPAIDGYVICISSGGAGLAGYPPLSPESAPLPLEDARRTVRGRGATVFEVLSEMESETNEPVTRADSDLGHDRYRLYQLAGTAHIEQRDEKLTNRAQFERAGGRHFHLEVKETRTDGRLDVVVRALFEAQLRWLVDGILAPRAGRFAYTPGWIEAPPSRFDRDDAPRVVLRELQRDGDGNVEGGVRTPWIVVPTASYSPHSTPAEGSERPPEWMPFARPELLANLMGSRRPFPAAELERRYGTFEEYRRRFVAAAGDLVSARLLLQPEADELVRTVRDRWGAST